MEVYTIMFIIAVIFSIVANIKNNKYKRIFFTILSFIPFIIVASIRYDVGTDYMYRNVPDFYKLLLGKDVGNLEILYKLIMKFCIFISKDYIVLFIVVSILMYTLIAISVGKNSKNILLSVIVFMVGSYYFQSLNLIRQYLGMAIMIFGYRYILDKKYIKWTICFILAVLIHTSCLIFIIVPFLNKKPIKLRYLVILSIFLIFLGKPILTFMFNFLEKFSSINIKKYRVYLLSEKGNLTLSSFLVEIFIYLYFYYIYFKNKDIGKEGNLLLNLQFLTVIFCLMNLYNSLFYRITSSFGIFQIFSIPYFWNFYHKDKINVKKTVITVNTIVCIFILCVMSVKMVYSNIINGNNEILPYKTIWERE